MVLAVDKELTAKGDFSCVNRSEMSRQLKMDVAHVSRVLTGKRNPSFQTAVRMAEYLGLTLDQFYKYTNTVKDQTTS